MTSSITPAEDGRYVDVFVPIAFKRFGGRKTTVAPDGTPIAPARSKATDSILIKALARAWRWQKLSDDGVYGSIAEMADKERINRSYFSRTTRLSLLAPDIVEAILNGTQPATLRLADLEGPFSIDWQEQHEAFGFAPTIRASPEWLASRTPPLIRLPTVASTASHVPPTLPKYATAGLTAPLASFKGSMISFTA